MDNLKSFKSQIIRYTLITALIFEAGSLPIKGFSLEYLCGLLAGTAVSVASVLIMIKTSEKVLASGQKWLSSIGYLIRLPVYGIVFLGCYIYGGITTGIACLMGFITGTTAIIYAHGIKPKFSKGKKDGEGNAWKK